MYYYILKKWRKITVLAILYTLYMYLYFDTFTTRWGVLEYVKGWLLCTYAESI